MPFTFRPTRHRLLAPLIGTAAVVAGLLAATTAPALASTTQISIMEPGPQLELNTTATLHSLRLLGVDEIRLNLAWNDIAPDAGSSKAPKHFNATDPAAYPAANWAPYDTVIRDAQADGIGIDLDLSGKAPQWAMPGHPALNSQGSYYPNATEYGQFYEAVAKRYDGSYTPSGATTPLPDVQFWSVWNEANYTASLKPQSTRHGKVNVPESPAIYRPMLDAAWRALKETGHGADKIVIGELTPRGYPNVGGGGMYPIVFVQSLYCLDSSYHELRGTIAREEGCPTNAAGSRRFRSQNPILFNATGISVHPYSRWYTPNIESYYTCKTGLCSSLADIEDLVRAVDKVQRVYGSSRKPPIYSTEYGYQTSPPKPHYDKSNKTYYISTANQALYLNWAEYISYKNPQIASFDQYLLEDPSPAPSNNYDTYPSGLVTDTGHYKPAYFAFRLPLYLPTTKFSSGHSVEVWGDVRPAAFASLDTGGAAQSANIEFEPKGSSTFSTVATITVSNRQGYFDVHEKFHGSGTVRLAYTYPASDMLLAPGYTVFSRNVSVTEG